MEKRILILTAGFGEGHNAAARGVRDGLAAIAGSEAQVELHDLFAEAYGLDYNIIEAIDQPFKTFEGGVGGYWGLFDADRVAKFSLTGPVSDPDHWKIAGLALLLTRGGFAPHTQTALKDFCPPFRRSKT